MKTNNPLLSSIAALAFCASACLAADYSIDWSTIDGGGGTSTGSVFAVSGTIGQPDAGTMSSGNYTLQGGFWGVITVVQTAGAPWLTLFYTSTNTVAVCWPNIDPNWKLHWTRDLGTGPWTDVAPPYPTSGTNCIYVELVPTGNKFYRLHKP